MTLCQWNMAKKRDKRREWINRLKGKHFSRESIADVLVKTDKNECVLGRRD